MHPEIILGPPGTGKTTTLLGMVEQELASGTAPDRIGYFSFTKKAASEAAERAVDRFGLTKGQLRYFRTLHSMCFQALGLSNSDVLEGKKTVEFGDWLGVKLSEHKMMDDTLMLGFTPGDRVMFMENMARVTDRPLRELYDEDDDGLSWTLVERVSRGLKEFKKVNELVDYTDMLRMFVDSDWTPNLEVLFVDEAQDLSRLQWHVVEKLARGCRRVVVAGDDDQAIYRWAGADVDHFVNLPGDAQVLSQSWRVPPVVQMLSSDVIGRVRNRRVKDWHAAEHNGVVTRANDTGELDWFAGNDILVLGRNSFVFRELERELKSMGVLYEARGHPSVSRRTLDAVRIWERLRRGEEVPSDDARTVYSLMSSGVGVKRGFKTLPNTPPDQPVSLEWLTQNGGLLRTEIWHEALDRVSLEDRTYLLRALQRGEKTTTRPRVRLSTIHGAKGGEAQHVVLLRDMARRTHQEMRFAPEDEARVWYVAVTRAREHLTVVAPETRMSYSL